MASTSSAVSSGAALINADPGAAIVGLAVNTGSGSIVTATIRHKVNALPVAVQVFSLGGAELPLEAAAAANILRSVSTAGATAGPGSTPGGNTALTWNSAPSGVAPNVVLRFKPNTIRQVILQDATYVFSAP